MFTFVLLDIPRPSQIFFQDTATPMMSGIIDLHQHVFFFVIIIFVIVMVQLFNIITFFCVTSFKKNLRNLISIKK
jgi:cytochrome c oxidase subunit 2